MESAQPGETVDVSIGGVASRGIVFDVPSRSKVVVAVVDPARGPVFRTVHPSALSDRVGEGTEDPALRLLIRRTSPPSHGTGRGGTGGGSQRAGHTRGSMHRTTGK